MSFLIKNAHIITPTMLWDKGWLLCQGSQIVKLRPGEAPVYENIELIDAQGLTLLSGFIDVHVHGGMGYGTMDATPKALRNMAQFFAKHGVTAFLATTWTSSTEKIRAALITIAEQQGQQPNGATLLGAHLEGPYLNPAQCGAQDENYIRRSTRNEALEFLDYDIIRLLALAPEYDENHWLIEECVRRNITVSAAHTASTFEQMQKAAALGVTQATHTYNGMIGLHHREPGTLGAVLTLPEIKCELIADNIHVHPAAMKILYSTKGPHGVILITDAVRGAGLPDGSKYEQDSRQVVTRQGGVYLPNNVLAGSTLTMNRALCNFLEATGDTLANIWQTSSLNAARAIHVADRKGSLEPGKDADLVLVDKSMNVHLTVAEGKIVYRKGI